MRRRPMLSAVSAAVVGSIPGCLGAPDEETSPGDEEQPTDREPSGDDDPAADDNAADTETEPRQEEPPTAEPPDGWFQPGFDAGNSRYAAGFAGPIDEPTRQQAYEAVDDLPLIANDTFYVSVTGTPNENIRMRSVGFDGEVRWDVRPDLHGFSTHGVIHEDTVVAAGSGVGICDAVSQDDGDQRWRTYLSIEPWSRDVSILEDRLYFATGHGVGCVDLDAHEEAWNVEMASEIASVSGGTFGGLAATPSHVFTLNRSPGNTRDFETDPRRLYALGPETGELDWSVDLEIRQTARRMLRPVIGDGHLFVISTVEQHPEGVADHDAWVHVVAADLDNRDVAWSTTLEGQYDAPGIVPAVGNGRLYVNHGIVEEGDTPLFSAIDTADGSVAWTVETTSTVLHPVVTDDLVYAVDSSVRALDPATGEERWNVELFEPEDPPDPHQTYAHASYPPLVYDGRLFVYLDAEGYIAFE